MLDSKEKEVIALVCFLVFNLFLVSRASPWNFKSFNEVSPVLFASGRSGSNVRKKPSTKAKIKFKLKPARVLELLEKKDKWYRVRHLEDKKEGWVHKIAMKKYLRLGYYAEPELGKSVFELEWKD